jgi:hypothetical protein
MANHEKKVYADFVHLLMAFKRTKDGEKATCMRVVIKDEEIDLKLLEHKCKLLGGEWRIHKTVNARDTEKARRLLLHKLIDFPEGRGFIDSLWITALLQTECIYGEKKFMLDVDTKDRNELNIVGKYIPNEVMIKSIETPAGWHFITRPFDTRELCKLPYVNVKRDGYYFIKKVGEK